MSKFNELPLSEALLNNLINSGYENPTAIQAEAIPVLVAGHDLLGIAQTGTGKTAAYCLPILEHLLKHPVKLSPLEPRALILAPTRELCSQINDSIETYGKDLGIKSCAIYGGVGQKTQVEALKRGADIVVATPGRLLDLLDQRHLRLSKVEKFVLDEADRMLDMGFIDDIQKIVERLPGKRQTMLFSATMPSHMLGLARKILRSPKRIEVTKVFSTAEKVDQKIIFCKGVDKYQLLKKIIKEEQTHLVLDFTRTKNSTDKVKEYLALNRIPSMSIHGDKNQTDRERALENFKQGNVKVLIATDIAARGIDIDDVSHVINFDLPLDVDSYVHRIGRTARAGKEGKAISFCEESEKEALDKIERWIQIRLPTETYKGVPESATVMGLLSREKRKITPPTPGKSQEKTAYLDHSKRQKVVKEGAAKPKHPGFKGKKKKR